jgi:hypothetical protein
MSEDKKAFLVLMVVLCTLAIIFSGMFASCTMQRKYCIQANKCVVGENCVSCENAK